MSQKVLVQPAETLEQRSASLAGGGTVLSATAVLIPVPAKVNYMSLIPHALAGALVAQWTLNPMLTIVKTDDLLVGGAYTNLSEELQDGDATDVAMDLWNDIASGHALYVGSQLPIRGCRVTIGTDPNNTASVLTVKYWNGVAWVDIGDTDGTISPAGTTMGATGDVTWTPPADWAYDSLVHSGDTTRPEFAAPAYWTRWEVSLVTEATWNITGLQPLNRSTAYAEMLTGQVRELSLPGERMFSCIEAKVNAGAGKLIVNVDSFREGF